MIGDYHFGSDVAYSTSDFTKCGGISFGLSWPINKNYGFELGGAIGSISFEYGYIMQYDFSLGLRFHNKFEIDNSLLNSVDPFLTFSSGVRMWQ